MIGDAPEPRRVEDDLAQFRRAVVAVDDERVLRDVVGPVVDPARVVRDELEERLHARLVLDDHERPALGLLEVKARVLLAGAIAPHHELAAVGDGGRDPGRVLAAGELYGETTRAVEAPELAHAGDAPAEVEGLPVRREQTASRRANVEHRLDA